MNDDSNWPSSAPGNDFISVLLQIDGWFVGCFRAGANQAGISQRPHPPVQWSIYTIYIGEQCTSGVYSYIIQCTRVVGMVGLPPPAEVVVTALHWALYQTLAPNFVPLHWLHCNTALVTLHCLHCICNILSDVHNMLSILLTDPNHTSYLSFHLHRHSVRLKYITPKTCYLWQNWIRVKRAQIGQTLCVRSYTAVKSLYIA